MEESIQRPSFLKRQVVPAVLSAIIAGPTAWMALDNDPPVIIVSAMPQTDAVLPGENLAINFIVDRNRSCPAHTDRYIIDGQSIRRELLGLDLPASPVAVHEHQTLLITIPLATSPGFAVYRATISYFCNAWQKWVYPLRVVLPDQHFVVLPKP